MKKNMWLLVLTALFCYGCKKNVKTACGTQVCTDIFASVGVHFQDKDNNPVAVSNYNVVDLRTNQQLKNVMETNGNLVPGFRIVADDSNLKDLSTDGDNLKVTGTNPATGQTLSVQLKISGGCNCHVSRVSGPDTIRFN